MSASEKLKALTIPLRTDDDEQWEIAMADFAEVMARTFPQIVAVVEAAENEWRGNKDDEAALDAAIAALDEALSQ